MKKLSFILAMALTTGMAMAQTAVVNQTSSVTNPQSIQTATVTQTGTSTVNILQSTEKLTYLPVDGVPVKFDHTATATQSGNGNLINITQIAEEHINGGSYENTANATQVGANNQMYQTQLSGNFTSGGMNFSSYQEGTGNIGTQYGKKTESVFTLYQNGKANISTQTTDGEKTGVLNAYVKQIGKANSALQVFHGENVRWAGASIDQNGSNNTAIQEFSSLVTLWNDPSKADIIQRSSDNYAYQSQVGQGSYQKTEQYGSNNKASMYSSGNFNNAFAYQNGKDAIIVIDQKQTAGLANSADGNLAKVYQEGTGSEAYVTQDGFRNKVVGLADDSYAINDNGSYLNVNQIGNDNLVRSQQTAKSASETVVQSGMGNVSIVNQY